MKTDHRIGGRLSVHCYRHPLVSSISGHLKCLEHLEDPGARRWTPLAASLAAVLMALEAHKPLFVRLLDARVCMAEDFAGPRQTGTTYNGLIKALLRQKTQVLPVLKDHLRSQVLATLPRIARTCGWTLLAVDGTKEELPRTREQEAFFGIADNGKHPQALVTAVVEVHTGLLWDWRIDRGDGSEKGHLEQMTPALPAHTLLLADGNFVGYAIWSGLIQSGKSFLIRVGGNVDLLTHLFPDAEMQCDGARVYAWPKHKQRRCPPLHLRLLKLGRGKKAVYLLTNVLDPTQLSHAAAGIIYRLRWGAEIFYRTFKRTMDLAKLKSRAGQRAAMELEWALIACCLVGLLGTQALHQAGQDLRRVSPAGLVHACRHALFHGQTMRLGRQGDRFHEMLSRALRDVYVRNSSKRSRHRPVTKNTPKTHHLKPPNRRRATPQERLRARECWHKLAA
jgi:hypothetical protein